MLFALLPLPEEKNEENAWNPILKLNDEIENNQVEKDVLIQRKRFLNEHYIIPIWYLYETFESLQIF